MLVTSVRVRPRLGSTREDGSPHRDEDHGDNPVAPTVDESKNKPVISQPSSDETPHGNKDGIRHQHQPDLGSIDNEEGDVDADVVGSIREGQ
jgi:hypothetical protein